MKKLYVLAALLMATTSAHAGNSISFEIEGHRIRIEAPRNCDSLSCIRVSAPSLSGSSFGGFKGFNAKSNDDNDVAERADPPKAAPAPAPAVQPTAPQPAAPVANPAPAANPAPSAPTAVATASPAPSAGFDASTPAAAPAVVPQAAPVAAAPAPTPTTPLGIWATEENKGNVRIEECGKYLCGYAVKTGEKILINMKPQDSRWTGQIHDPDSGRNYDSTIALKGSNALRVQGCAFGGMFCGGQTWKRVG
jgi:uncharacterized protein (DUF2147 family)